MNRLKLLLLSSVILLSGCSLLDAYLMAGYDNQEYALVNKIRTKAQIAQTLCEKPVEANAQVNDLIYTSIELKNFTQHIPRNPEAYKMSGQLVELTKQIKFDEKTSSVFCKLKFQQVERNAEKIQQVLGSKPR